MVLLVGSARPAAGRERAGELPVARAEPASGAQAQSATAAAPLERGPYAHFLGALAYGRGLRFNNPYRLSTVLGSSPESLSLTAPYLRGSLGAVFGDPEGLQHGGALHVSIALGGVPQEVLAPSYLALVRFEPRTLGYARLGVPLVLEPDFSAGAEVGVGGAWLVTAGLGLTAELSGSLFYGAATDERRITTIPVLALELGVLIDYEILP